MVENDKTPFRKISNKKDRERRRKETPVTRAGMIGGYLSKEGPRKQKYK